MTSQGYDPKHLSMRTMESRSGDEDDAQSVASWDGPGQRRPPSPSASEVSEENIEQETKPYYGQARGKGDSKQTEARIRKQAKADARTAFEGELRRVKAEAQAEVARVQVMLDNQAWVGNHEVEALRLKLLAGERAVARAEVRAAAAEVRASKAEAATADAEARAVSMARKAKSEAKAAKDALSKAKVAESKAAFEAARAVEAGAGAFARTKYPGGAGESGSLLPGVARGGPEVVDFPTALREALADAALLRLELAKTKRELQGLRVQPEAAVAAALSKSVAERGANW